jgi:hypothetical protein
LTSPLSGDVQRNAVSASLGYMHDGRSYAGKYEYRHDKIDNATTGTTERDTYLMHNTVGLKFNSDWRFIGKLNGSYSTSTVGDFYRGDYLEAVSGMAYRPVNNDRLNALFKYTFFYDLPTQGQANAATGLGDYAQKSHVLSADAAYDIHPVVTIGGKYAIRAGELKDNKLGGPWFDSTAQLLIGRIDLHFVKNWDAIAELRTLNVTTAADRKTGALIGVYRHLGDNFKLGVGYNFTDFSDDLTNLSTKNKGVFVNAIGKF